MRNPFDQPYTVPSTLPTPAAGRVLVADVVAQQELRQPLAGAHQIDSYVLTRTDQIAQRFLLGRRHPDRVQRVDHQQPHQPLGVTRVGLDLVLRRTLDLARRRDHTPDPRRHQRPRQPVTRRAGLIGGSRPARGSPEQNATTSAVSPLNRCTVISPDSASTTHAITFAACTSSPTQLRTFAMVGTPSVWCCRRPPRPSPSARLTQPHAVRAAGADLPSTTCRPILHTV